MKKNILFVSALSILLGAGLLVTSCGGTAPDTEEPGDTEVTKYNVNVPADTSSYKIVGINADGYAEGDTVTFGIVLTDGSLTVDEVSATSTSTVAVTNEGGNIYTFTMPAADVTVTATFSAVIVDNSLETALAEAQTGALMDSVFIENQHYVDSTGAVTSSSRYARRVTSQMEGGFNQVTRYDSVYDYESMEGPIDVSETEPDTIYIFAQSPDNGYLSTASLEIDNKIHYYDVLNTATDANMSWYQTFSNPFALLTVDDFEQDATDTTIYHLKTDKVLLADVYTSFAQNIFGDIQLDYHVSEFSVKVEDGHFTSYEGKFETCEWDWYNSEVVFSGEFTKFGTEVFTEPTAYTGATDTDLENALTELRKQNYTVKVSEKYTSSWTGETTDDVTIGYSDGGNRFLQDLYATNADLTTDAPIETYLYKQGSEESWSGALEYFVEQGVKIRDTFYKFSSNREGITIAGNMLPTFAISSAFFEKDGSTYTLKSDLPYYLTSSYSSIYSPFTSTAMNEVSITLGENGDVTFVTSDPYGTTETVTYTKVGSTTVADSAITTDVSELTTWEDYFKTDAVVEEVHEVLPSEVINLVPTPVVSTTDAPVTNVAPNYLEYDSETGERSMQIVIALDSFGDNVDLQFDDLLVYFSQAMPQEGFVYNTENLYEYEFTKTMNVLGLESDVSISFGGYSTYFVVEYNVAPVTTAAE